MCFCLVHYFCFLLGWNYLWFPPVLTLPYMKMDAMCIILRSKQHRDSKARSEPLGFGVAYGGQDKPVPSLNRSCWLRAMFLKPPRLACLN